MDQTAIIKNINMIVGTGLVVALTMLLSGQHSDFYTTPPLPLPSTTAGGGTTRQDLFLAGAILVSSLLVFLAIAIITSEKQIDKKPRTILGSPEYDITPVNAPSISNRWWLLQLVAKIIGHPILGHIIVRPIINGNRPDQLRDLARQIAAAAAAAAAKQQKQQQKIPIISVPLCRSILTTTNNNTTNTTNTTTDQMAATATDALQNGLPRSYYHAPPPPSTSTTSTVVKATQSTTTTTTTTATTTPSPVVAVNGVLDYHAAYKTGTVTPSQIMQRTFKAMDELKYMNMFVACHRENVLRQAQESDARWKNGTPRSVFDGVPIAVKDTIQVCGYQCSNGMVLHSSDPISNTDDIMVQRFRQAGAIILGTTVMTEYGRCPLGYNSHYQGPFNPYDDNRYSGGSSSGSVCAVMTGLVPVAISFDGGGSIRIPAALSGSFGLAPTFGRIPFDSDVCWTSGNVHAGTNTATATDSALAYALLAQNEPGHIISEQYDGNQRGPPRPHLTDFDKIDDFSGLRIGIFWDYFNDSDPEIVAQCKAVVNELTKRGATIVPVAIPHLKALSVAHGFNISAAFSSLQEEHFYQRNDLEPATMIQLQLGKTLTAVEYMATNRLRGWAMNYIKTLFAEKMDVFITPACPIVAPLLPKSARSHGESNIPLYSKVMKYMFLVNLAGFAGMTMPVAYSQDNNNPLPIGIHVMADHWNDALLLRIAHFVEKHCLQRKSPKHFVKISLHS